MSANSGVCLSVCPRDGHGSIFLHPTQPTMLTQGPNPTHPSHTYVKCRHQYCRTHIFTGPLFHNYVSSKIGMLIPGKSQFPGLDRDSRFRPSTYFYLRGSPAGSRRRGGGDHRPDPAPFPADDGTPSPPADDQHSRQWRTQNDILCPVFCYTFNVVIVCYRVTR